MKAAAVIPARYNSTRFPGKPLADIAGKSMIARVYDQTQKAGEVDRVRVATDDERIRKEVEKFGGEAVMTDRAHTSGTDRIAEAAADLEADIIANVQGDEPLIKPDMIDKAIRLVKKNSDVEMSTLAAPMSEDKIEDRNIVKVVIDLNGNALYFSRAPIPAAPGREKAENDFRILQHIGLYVFRKNFLLKFSELSPTPLEKREKLEQLRALEHGYKIKVGIARHHGPGVDRPEDVKSVEKILGGGDN